MPGPPPSLTCRFGLDLFLLGSLCDHTGEGDSTGPSQHPAVGNSHLSPHLSSKKLELGLLAPNILKCLLKLSLQIAPSNIPTSTWTKLLIIYCSRACHFPPMWKERGEKRCKTLTSKNGPRIERFDFLDGFAKHTKLLLTVCPRVPFLVWLWRSRLMQTPDPWAHALGGHGAAVATQEVQWSIMVSCFLVCLVILDCIVHIMYNG